MVIGKRRLPLAPQSDAPEMPRCKGSPMSTSRHGCSASAVSTASTRPFFSAAASETVFRMSAVYRSISYTVRFASSVSVSPADINRQASEGCVSRPSCGQAQRLV